MNNSPLLMISNNADKAGEVLIKILEQCAGRSDQVTLAALEAFQVCGQGPNHVSINNCNFTSTGVENDESD